MAAPMKHPPAQSAAVPPVANGDNLDRLEFERCPNTMPEVNKAERIEGVVYLSAPVKYGHHSRTKKGPVG
jgi:hypothetical protein